MKKIWLFLAMLFTCLLAGPGTLAADVTAFRAAERNDGKPPFVRLVLDLTAGIKATASLDKSGETLSVVLKDSAPLAEAEKDLAVNKQNVKSASLKGDGDDARLTVNLKNPMAMSDIKVFALKKNGDLPPRLVVDISSISTAVSDEAASETAALPEKQEAPAAEEPKPAVAEGPKPAAAEASKTAAAEEPKTAAAEKPKAVAAEEPKAAAAEEPKAAAEEKKDRTSVKKESRVKGSSDKKSKKKDKKSSDKKSKSSSKNVPATIVVTDDDKKILKGKIICLDPGHGGADVGAIGTLNGKAVYEKDINLSIALPLRDMLKDAGAKVIMTRSTDKDVSRAYASDKEELQARCNVAAKGKAHIFVSVHIDSFSNSTVDGTTAYYYPKTGRDLLLARSLHQSMMTNMAIPDRGVRSNDLYVNKNTKMPSVLMEMGFISNPHRLRMLTSSWGPKRIAECMYQGIVNYFRDIS